MTSFLWLLVMTAGRALKIWLVPPREIEARLKEQSCISLCAS